MLKGVFVSGDALQNPLSSSRKCVNGNRGGIAEPKSDWGVQLASGGQFFVYDNRCHDKVAIRFGGAHGSICFHEVPHSVQLLQKYCAAIFAFYITVSQTGHASNQILERHSKVASNYFHPLLELANPLTKASGTSAGVFSDKFDSPAAQETKKLSLPCRLGIPSGVLPTLILSIYREAVGNESDDSASKETDDYRKRVAWHQGRFY